MIKDAQGQPVSGATAEAVVLYDQAVRAFNLGYGDSLACSTWRVRHRPISPWRIWRRHGCLFWLTIRPCSATREPCFRQLRSLTMNEREHAHSSALGQAVMGARSVAASVLDRHLMRYPCDLVAHQAVTLLDGYLGRFGGCGTGQRALPFWSKDMPGYGTILCLPRLRPGRSG